MAERVAEVDGKAETRVHRVLWRKAEQVWRPGDALSVGDRWLREGATSRTPDPAVRVRPAPPPLPPGVRLKRRYRIR